MKTNDEMQELTPEENLNAENELLKMKLTAEFGMESSGVTGSELPSDVENQWLNHIYDFEKMYKDAKKIKIYEYIGKPEYKKFEELNTEEIESELDRLLEIIEKESVNISFCCDYEDEIVYRFITEEFFHEEIDDIRIPGMRTCFCYEEFHPNHDYDIRYLAEHFFNSFLKPDWYEKSVDFELFEIILHRNNKMERIDFVKLLINFRDSVKPVEVSNFQIDSVKYNFEDNSGDVCGKLSYIYTGESNTEKEHSGEFRLGVTYNDFYWAISEIKFPGFE